MRVADSHAREGAVVASGLVAPGLALAHGQQVLLLPVGNVFAIPVVLLIAFLAVRTARWRLVTIGAAIGAIVLPWLVGGWLPRFYDPLPWFAAGFAPPLASAFAAALFGRRRESRHAGKDTPER